MSLLLSKHFLIEHFTNFMHASTCLLVWYWYDEVITWSMFSCLQNCLTQSDTKFVTASETIFSYSPHSAILRCCFNQVISWKTISFFHNREFAVVIYNTYFVLFLIENISAPTISQGLYGISYGIIFSCGCVCWYSRHAPQCFTVFLMLTFIFIRYND